MGEVKPLVVTIGGSRALLGRVDWAKLSGPQLEGVLEALARRPVAVSLRLMQGCEGSDDGVLAEAVEPLCRAVG